ncbi:MAG TPA: hypothetical protein VN605_02480 [Thermoanaerobaculia bacterium]|nr:hypothetical protein [Thermoanaerobaculia bacterium]
MTKVSVADVYTRAEWLCESLRSHGQAQAAEEVAMAIAAGATGTEILMALRWHLQRLRAASTLSAEEIAVADEIVATIHQLLNF